MLEICCFGSGGRGSKLEAQAWQEGGRGKAGRKAGGQDGQGGQLGRQARTSFWAPQSAEGRRWSQERVPTTLRKFVQVQTWIQTRFRPSIPFREEQSRPSTRWSINGDSGGSRERLPYPTLFTSRSSDPGCGGDLPKHASPAKVVRCPTRCQGSSNSRSSEIFRRSGPCYLQRQFEDRILFSTAILAKARQFVEFVASVMARSWQTSITPEVRQRKRQELVDNFPTHIETLAIDGRVGPQQRAQILEEKAYNNANSRIDYVQKISRCIQLSQNNHSEYERLLVQWRGLSVGGDSSQPRAVEQGSSSSSTMGQNQVPAHIQPAQVQNTLEPATQDAEITGVSPVEIERDNVWAKLEILNAKYLQDMNELYIMLTHRSNQPMPAEQLQKLKHYKDVLHRMIPYLRVPKERVPKEFNMEKVEAFEKQITSIMDTFKRRRNPQPEVGSGAPAVAGVQVN